MSEPKWLRDAREEGRILSDTGPTLESASELIEAAFESDNGRVCWTIPVKTASEINGREWRKRSKRTDGAWKAVSREVGPRLSYLAWWADEYHTGGRPVYVKFTRLGGRRLDPSNLPSALKACEDAITFVMGIDDGDERWKPRYEQEPGSASGVRVEFFVSKERWANA